MIQHAYERDIKDQLAKVREQEQLAVELKRQWDISLQTRNRILATCIINPLIGEEREQYKYHKGRMAELEKAITAANWLAGQRREVYQAMLRDRRYDDGMPAPRAHSERMRRRQTPLSKIQNRRRRKFGKRPSYGGRDLL